MLSPKIQRIIHCQFFPKEIKCFCCNQYIQSKDVAYTSCSCDCGFFLQEDLVGISRNFYINNKEYIVCWDFYSFNATENVNFDYFSVSLLLPNDKFINKRPSNDFPLNLTKEKLEKYLLI